MSGIGGEAAVAKGMQIRLDLTQLGLFQVRIDHLILAAILVSISYSS
jgi:hypothetical protein